MVTRRPSLPIGFTLAGTPAIEMALLADDRAEVYRLISGGEATELLVLHRGDSSSTLKWWEFQSERGINLKSVIRAEELLGFSAGAHLSVRGEQLKTGTHASSNSETLEALLFELIECVSQSRVQDLLPDLSATFCWRTHDGKIRSVLPRGEGQLSEKEAVRYVARSFFTMASGVSVDNAPPKIPLLSQWCRGAGGRLSETISACLSSERGARTISTFAELNSELGRPTISGSNAEGRTSEPEAVSSQSGSGLSKVAGMQKLKALLRAEVVEPVRNPGPFQQYGLSIPNGILLYGPPGCGKTYIARALAEELGHHFLEIVPSELASPYVHGSVIRIRELFDEAAERAPSVVFIDEFEALVPVRSGLGGFQHHKAEEVNEILTHLNSSSEKRIFIIAATNQPEMIDPAVRRTGRLDKLIYVGPPDQEARHDMLLLHLTNRPVSEHLNVDQLAAQLSGYSASDLKFLVDEAARDALTQRLPISMESFERAMARISASIPAEMELQYQSVAQRGH